MRLAVDGHGRGVARLAASPTRLCGFGLWLESSTFRFNFASFKPNALPLLSTEPSDLHREDGVGTCFRHPEQFHDGLSGCMVIGCICHGRDQLFAAVQTGRDCGDDFESFIHLGQELSAAGWWIFAVLYTVG
ncbi:hypothetical protein [Rhodococcus sp. NPDC127528]|uniref:hypothetical protein n=1 Tax=unclassified Rhodococcus (in: high G+C Gram-positive bacteria) TaxID=192944 RepID=UPI00362D12EF